MIAIIAILAAILFPVFAQARESAKLTVCLSNNKQVGLSTLMYFDDNDDMAPMGMSMNAPTQTLSFVHDRTSNYRKSAEVLQCPSYPTGKGGQDYTGVHGGSAQGSLLEAIRQRVGAGLRMANTFRYNAYTWNFGVFGMPTMGTSLPPYALGTPYTQSFPINGSQMEKVAETITFTDGYFPRKYTTENLTGYVNWWYKWEIWPRHRGGIILSYADGHAKFSRAQAMPTGGKVTDSCPTWLGGNSLETYYSWTRHVSQALLNTCGIREGYPKTEKQHECVDHPLGTPNWGDIHGVPGTCIGDISRQ